MKTLGMIALLLTAAFLGGCGSDAPAGQNMETVESQPAADLEAGAKAKTMEDWAAANPNNGAPGSGEQGAGK